jgi:hypothetical protein
MSLYRPVPTFVLHVGLHNLMSYLLRRLLPPDVLVRLTSSELASMAEKLPSSINALLVSVPTMNTIIRKKAFQRDVFRPYPDALDKVFSDHFAFTMYDMVIMWKNKEHASVWLHHVIGAIGTYFMRYYKVASFFPAAFLATELTVVTSNILWAMQKLGKENTRAYHAMLVIRCITFVLFRLPVGPLCMWYALRETKKAQQENPQRKSFWQEVKDLPLLVSTVSGFNIIVLTVLNTWWTLQEINSNNSSDIFMLMVITYIVTNFVKIITSVDTT